MRELSDVISKLGEMTSDDIALHFEEYGIKAVPRRANQCAIAEYVRQETALKYISVDIQNTSGLNDEMIPSGAKLEKASNPRSVREFITGFDLGKYPNLIDTKEGW